MPISPGAVHRRLALLAAVLTALGAVLGALASTAPAAAAAARTGPVIVVGTAGLRWDDVSAQATPNLWKLLEHGSQAAMTIRNLRRTACPVDGWLALSAGRRAADLPADPGRACRATATPGTRGTEAVVPGWQAYVDYAGSGDYASEPGLLAQQLSVAKVPYAAIGDGAAIALASPQDGVVRGDYASLPQAPTEITAAVTTALATARVVVIDVGAVRDPNDLPVSDLDHQAGPRASQVQTLDERIGAVLAAAPSTGTLIVASLADSGYTPHLQLLSMQGLTPPGSTPTQYPPALLGASSTRQDGLVQVTDLTPTILELAGAPAPEDLPGATVLPQSGTPSGLAARRQALIDLDEAAVHIQTLVPPFFNGLVIAQILLYGAGTLALRKEWGGIEGRRRVLALLRRVAIVFAAVPVSTFLANLVPWWRTDYQLATIVAAVCVGVAAIATVALLGPWRDRRLGPLGFVAGVTAAVLALDVSTGSRLQTSSLMGLQPLVGGRFYGLGNVQFALFASGSLMLACSLADAALKAGRKQLAVGVIMLIGVITVVVDGTPGLGSDFGGPPAVIPAFLVMALLVAGVRVTWRRLVLIAVVTLAVVSLISVADWLRPPAQRTHLGRFVQTIIEGGAMQVIARKAAQNWEILTSSWLTILVPFGAVFIAVILMRPVAWGAPALQRTYEAAPTLRHALVSLCLMLAIGFAVNDSGTVVPAIGAVLVIPLLIAASVRTLEMADDETRQSDLKNPTTAG